MHGKHCYMAWLSRQFACSHQVVKCWIIGRCVCVCVCVKTFVALQCERAHNLREQEIDRKRSWFLGWWNWYSAKNFNLLLMPRCHHWLCCSVCVRCKIVENSVFARLSLLLFVWFAWRNLFVAFVIVNTFHSICTSITPFNLVFCSLFSFFHIWFAEMQKKGKRKREKKAIPPTFRLSFGSVQSSADRHLNVDKQTNKKY